MARRLKQPNFYEMDPYAMRRPAPFGVALARMSLFKEKSGPFEILPIKILAIKNQKPHFT